MGRVAVIGAGFAGLSAAAYLGAAGHQVQVFEKNGDPGGRARQRKVPEGYTFDMGPSWYWMPDVFERFFADFGSRPADHYELQLLDPGFEIVFDQKKVLPVPAGYDRLRGLFDLLETGSGPRLDRFMRDAQYKYDTAMGPLIYTPALSIKEYIRFKLLRNIFKLQLHSSLRRQVRKHFHHPQLVALLEFPVLFLGATPDKIPALYSLMNYAGLKLGTWYPDGGFGSVVRAMVKVGTALHVNYSYNSSVDEIVVRDGRVTGLIVNGDAVACDAVVAAADYHHVEQELLPPSFANYSGSYWQSRTMAPSCLIFYLGVAKRLPALQHHTLFFDTDGDTHAREIYDQPAWPSDPQFYVGCPSRTDPKLAPAGHENLFMLMPLAPGLADSEAMREKYFQIMITRLEAHAGEPIAPFIDYKQSYGVHDFMVDYHAFRGNAYGLANTLGQTAWRKPRIRNKKLNNLFYAGQLTVPGPGVPPAVISGKIAAGQVNKYFKNGL